MTMDAHRKLMACIAVFAMLACMVPAVTDIETTDAYGDADGILLYQVNSIGDKGVTLKNYSSTTIDLKGYSVSDNEKKSTSEGYFTFTSSFKLSANDTITIVLTKDTSSMSNQKNVYLVGDNTIGVKMTGKFTPADKADDIYLYNPDGEIIDAMCYGTKTITNSTYWTGSSVGYSTHILQRSGNYDTDSADDWFIYIDGLTYNELNPNAYTATVTPFLFPDSGGIPIYRALEKAEKSVFIEMYELRSPNIYALLIELENKGVEVTILHEGNPVGNTVPEFASNMKALIDAGGEVRFIGGTAYDRYDNVHAKYAIIDMETVIITSENWSGSNCNGEIDNEPYVGGNSNGNRGWGVIVDCPDYALYMKDVFDHDNLPDFKDTYDFNDKYSYTTAASLTYTAPEQVDFKSYTATITPVLSNDNSYAAFEYIIGNATERVYSQQQSLSSYYANLGETSPVMMMAKQANANPGMDAKFILGEGKNDTQKQEAIRQVLLVNSSTAISAATMASPYVHNKGVIGDDMVLVSSINWTPTSVENNRETGVIIKSQEVSDYFANAFNRDFERYYTYDGFKVDISEIKTTYPSGKEATVSVTVTPSSDTYTYFWDFGDGQTKETTVPRTTFKPTDGAHVLKVTVTNSSGISQTTSGITYYVGSDIPTDPQGPTGPGSSTEEGKGLDIQTIIDEYGYYIIPIIVVILGLIGAALKHR